MNTEGPVPPELCDHSDGAKIPYWIKLRSSANTLMHFPLMGPPNEPRVATFVFVGLRGAVKRPHYNAPTLSFIHLAFHFVAGANRFKWKGDGLIVGAVKSTNQSGKSPYELEIRVLAGAIALLISPRSVRFVHVLIALFTTVCVFRARFSSEFVRFEKKDEIAKPFTPQDDLPSKRHVRLLGVPMRRERFIGAGVVALLLLANAASDPAAPPQTKNSAGLSRARVVRLSFVEGKAAIRTPGSDQWTEATVNTPIQEGFSVSTDQKSFAEVQFENGSTVRLGAVSIVDFTQLALTPQGGHINHLALEQGYASFDFSAARHDEYVVSVGGVDLTAEGKSQFRADAGDERLRVEVFSGNVRAADSNRSETVGQNHTLLRDSNNPSAPLQISDKVDEDDWDKWVRARTQQSTLAMKDEAITAPGSTYGWDDLDVYGEWSYFPGYGNAWAPYEQAGWSPYSAGSWGWYPGMGYTWISAEPWGWLPFHYGFWNFDAGMGWFWMPGSMAAWNPALVNWYSGPGWIGWSPIGEGGIGGAAPCTLAVAGCLMAVRPGALSDGEPIEPGSAQLVHPRSAGHIMPIARPDVAPVSSASAARPPFPRLVTLASGRDGTAREGRDPNGFQSATHRGFARGPEGAPSTVIQGQRPEAEAFEGRAALSSPRKTEPMRMRLGPTIGGGRFFGAPGEGPRERSAMPGEEPRDRAGAGPLMIAPRVLPRTSLGGVARPWSRSGAGESSANLPGGATGGVGSGSRNSSGGKGGSGGSSSGGGSGGGGHH